MGKSLRDHKIDQAYSSELVRTQETLDDVLAAAEQTEVPRQVDALLNERDYGDYTGLNKWDVQTELGGDVFHQVRRSWDYPIPNGETLQVLHGRLVPFYEEQILPQLHAGKTVLLVSHGNPLRALIKHLESISDKDIAEVEMPFGHVLIYTVRPDGRAHQRNTALWRSRQPMPKPSQRRRRRQNALGLLFGLIMLAIAVALAPSNALRHAPSNTVTDVSWPNCKALPAAEPSAGIVGVNGGLDFHSNRCLYSESRLFTSYELYLNTGYPGTASHRKFTAFPRACGRPRHVLPSLQLWLQRCPLRSQLRIHSSRARFNLVARC